MIKSCFYVFFFNCKDLNTCNFSLPLSFNLQQNFSFVLDMYFFLNILTRLYFSHCRNYGVIKRPWNEWSKMYNDFSLIYRFFINKPLNKNILKSTNVCLCEYVCDRMKHHQFYTHEWCLHLQYYVFGTEQGALILKSMLTGVQKKSGT